MLAASQRLDRLKTSLPEIRSRIDLFRSMLDSINMSINKMSKEDQYADDIHYLNDLKHYANNSGRSITEASEDFIDENNKKITRKNHQLKPRNHDENHQFIERIQESLWIEESRLKGLIDVLDFCNVETTHRDTAIITFHVNENRVHIYYGGELTPKNDEEAAQTSGIISDEDQAGGVFNKKKTHGHITVKSDGILVYHRPPFAEKPKFQYYLEDGGSRIWPAQPSWLIEAFSEKS